MHPTLRRVVAWTRRRAENVVAALMGVMFLAFIIQIVFRYFLDLPIGWTSELSVIAWLYLVLLGSAFWLRDDEAIRFDLVAESEAVRPRTRRAMAFLAAAGGGVLFAIALPATVSYVAFMKVESTSYLKIRLDLLYSVYVVFAVAVVVRCAWAAWTALRGTAPDAGDAGRPGGADGA